MVERSTIFHGINEAAFILGQNFVSGRYLGIGRHDLKVLTAGIILGRRENDRSFSGIL